MRTKFENLFPEDALRHWTAYKASMPPADQERLLSVEYFSDLYDGCRAEGFVFLLAREIDKSGFEERINWQAGVVTRIHYIVDESGTPGTTWERIG